VRYSELFIHVSREVNHMTSVKKLGLARPTFYFQYRGEANTGKALELLGAGTKIGVEAALMAIDAGVLDAGQESIALGGTYKGLDTALVVQTSYSRAFFSDFEVLAIIAKPRRPGRRLPEYEQEGWKGNLDQYYEPIRC
jgi:hypothetical protein